jgi:hypothetical protein
MKRFGYLFEKIKDKDSIRLAHKNARKGKLHYDEVKEVDSNLDYYLDEVYRLLDSGEFTTSEYTIEDKLDKGKLRTLYKLPYFPDRIVHHVIMQVLEPIWEPTLIANTFQSLKGRGPHKALKKIRKEVLGKEGMYYLQLDVVKYYPSICNDRLKSIIRTKIKCPGTLRLLDDIIDSCKGVPIGNYISQYFGNLYLNRLDHEISAIQGITYYRYCDDIVCISSNKELLWKVHKIVLDSMDKLDLKLKYAKLHLITESVGLDFLGYVVYSNRVLLRSRIRDAAYEGINEYNLHSYVGWLKHCNGYNLTKELNRKLK